MIDPIATVRLFEKLERPMKSITTIKTPTNNIPIITSTNGAVSTNSTYVIIYLAQKNLTIPYPIIAAGIMINVFWIYRGNSSLTVNALTTGRITTIAWFGSNPRLKHNIINTVRSAIEARSVFSIEGVDVIANIPFHIKSSCAVYEVMIITPF